MANIEQEGKEAPGKFLDRLKEALRRLADIDPKSEEGRMILKDRFLIQSAPDIHHKLLKQVYQTAYYGREYEGKAEKDKGTG